MEKLFEALGNPSRLWVIRYLVANGPTKQIELARAFAEAGLSPSSEVNGGAMSHIVKPLISAGLIHRPRRNSREPLRLRHEEQTRRLLSIASALDVAVADDSQQAANKAHAQLMRDLTGPVKASAVDEAPSG
jgi:hypothetical protein